MRYLPFLAAISAVLISCSNPSEPPKKVYVNSVTVNTFPSTNSGNNWDPDASGPDIFPMILLGTTEVWNASASHYSNCTNTASYTFTAGLPVELDLNSQYSIQIWDYDPLDPNDYVGGYYFSTSTSDPSNTIKSGDASSTLQIEMELSWIY